MKELGGKCRSCRDATKSVAFTVIDEGKVEEYLRLNSRRPVPQLRDTVLDTTIKPIVTTTISSFETETIWLPRWPQAPALEPSIFLSRQQRNVISKAYPHTFSNSWSCHPSYCQPAVDLPVPTGSFQSFTTHPPGHPSGITCTFYVLLASSPYHRHSNIKWFSKKRLVRFYVLLLKLNF